MRPASVGLQDGGAANIYGQGVDPCRIKNAAIDHRHRPGNYHDNGDEQPARLSVGDEVPVPGRVIPCRAGRLQPCEIVVHMRRRPRAGPRRCLLFDHCLDS